MYSSSVRNRYFKQDILAIEKYNARVPVLLPVTFLNEKLLRLCSTRFSAPSTRKTEGPTETDTFLQSYQQSVTSQNPRICHSFLQPHKPHKNPCSSFRSATDQLSLVTNKPVIAICEPQRRRSACASAQSDQHLCCSLPR